MEDLVGLERLLSFTIGGHYRSKVAQFYMVIVELLKLLDEVEEGDLGAAYCRTKTELHVVNPHRWEPERQWGEKYMKDHLKPLLKSVKEKHPSLALQVDITGHNGDNFDCINRVTLDWRLPYRDRALFNETTDESYTRPDTDSEHSSMFSSDENMSGDEDITMDSD